MLVVEQQRRCPVFRSIVVPLDLDVVGDRALPIAGSLARLGGLPLELLTIESPRMAGFQDVCELGRRVKANGLGPHSINVLHDDDPGRAITGYVASRNDALIVMGSTAKGPLREQAFGSVSEHVLAHAHRPVLIVGPHVEGFDVTKAPSLVVGVDESDPADAAIPVIESWQRTFGGGVVRVVEVAPLAVGADATLKECPDSAPALLGEPDQSHRLARLLTDRGIAATWEILYGGDPAAQLDDLAADLSDAVVVATTTGWTTPGIHWHSTTRKIARHSTRPVLVVPA
jgi:nucleotide-binding universal stress UspA family protein